MGDLPDVVQEAGLLFQRQGIQRDPEAMQQIVAWGRGMIDAAYPDDPVRAPLNVVKRHFAHREWNRVVRTAGRELRGVVANSLVRELEFEIQRRQTDILARDAEARRQEGVLFDAQVRVREYDLTTQIDTKSKKELMDHAHKLEQKSQAADFTRQTQASHRDHALTQHAEDNASTRRITEHTNVVQQEINRDTNAVHQEIIKLTSQAILATMGTSSGQEVLELVAKVSNEVTRIRSDPDLTDDDKHLQVKTLLDSLPLMLKQVQES